MQQVYQQQLLHQQQQYQQLQNMSAVHPTANNNPAPTVKSETENNVAQLNGPTSVPTATEADTNGNKQGGGYFSNILLTGIRQQSYMDNKIMYTTNK